jgi:diaminopimelate decarboxylase
MISHLQIPKDQMFKILKKESPFFLYSENELMERINDIKFQFRGVFKNQFELSFSLKSQPNYKVIETVKKSGLSLDVASYEELRYALELGFLPERLALGGCGLTDKAIQFAFESNIFAVHCDCHEALVLATQLKSTHKMKTRVTIRYQPENFVKTKIGFYLNELESLGAYQLDGLHVYMGRDSYVLEGFQTVLSECSRLMSNRQQFVKNPTLFLGPGLPSHFENIFPNSINEFKFNIKIELGRSLVSKSGYYGAPVLAVKRAPGDQMILIIEGGLQHLGSPWVTLKEGPTKDLPAFFDQAGTPLMVKDNQTAAVFGSLCLWQDCLHPRLPVPPGIKRGDWIVVPNMGAYGLTAGVPLFIGENLPNEYFLTEDRIEEVSHQKFKYGGP